jgi:ABC-2 type transport system permease protein
MRALWMLSVANLKSFVRDRAALFWTLAFPVIFVVLFGTIFSGGQAPTYTVGWVDLDGTPATTQLRSAVDQTTILVPTDEPDQASAEAAMRAGDIDAIVVVPKGLGAAIDAGRSGQPAEPVDLVVPHPSPNASAAITQTMAGVAGALNLQLTGRQAVLGIQAQTIQAQTLNGASYFVPSILAMALMQLGVFAAVPLVALREKLVLKRLSATPLTRRTLVGGNVSVRLIIGASDGDRRIGVTLLNVTIIGGTLAVAGLVVPGP